MAGVPRTELEVSGFSHPSTDAWVLHFNWPKNPLPIADLRGVAAPVSAAAVHGLLELGEVVGVAGAVVDHPPGEGCFAAAEGGDAGGADAVADLVLDMFDALVLERVVADDKPALMTKPRGEIRHYHQGHGLVTAPGFTFHIHRIEIGEDF